MKDNEKALSNTRNYGIDLLRIFAMFLIVILHSLGQGGILQNSVLDSSQYKFVWALEIFAYCAVNIFGLISGYVSYTDKEKPFKISNYIKIWLEVVFYGIVVTFLFSVYKPDLVTKKDYIYALFPVSNNLYWYFSAYTALFFIMPLLNKAIRNSSNETLIKSFIAIILVFSIFDTITSSFVLNRGYSFVWLALLYILGAIMKKCQIGKNLKLYKIVLGIIIFDLITYLFKIYGFETKLLDVEITKGTLISYTSPTILGSAILFVIGFSKIKFNNVFTNIVKFAAPSAFSIYILNNQRLFWLYIMNSLFVNIANDSIKTIFLYVIGFSLGFTIIAIFIDKIRQLLFKLLHINALADKLSAFFSKISI